MAQIDRLFTSIWHNTTTGPGTPLTGLSATITIRDKGTNTVVVNNQAMTEIGGGEYDYTFATMDATKPYSYVMNPNSTSAYVVTGFVDPRLSNLDKNLSQINGGGYKSGNDFSATDRDNIEKIKKIIDTFPDEFNEINSHIDIAKQATIDTIDSIEQAEVDTSDILKGIGTIKEQNTKLASYLKGEAEKEKAEMETSHTKMMADMEQAYSDMEDANASTLEEKDNEKTSILSDANEIIQAIEDEKIAISQKNRIEIIDKIKTLI